MPVVESELKYGSVFQLLVAVVLSAQCTDRRVNMVSPELFRHFPDARSMVQAIAFGKQTMAVDTHVFRVSHRIGLVSKSDDTPYKVEQCLIKNIPGEDIPRAHHWLLLHGRYVCTARKPHCEKCAISDSCAGAFP